MSDERLARLLESAKDAKEQAYCIYSKFPVGAAVLREDGSVEVGANVENASYGLAVCAERVALFRTVTSEGVKPVAIAVSCGEEGQDLAEASRLPCGACLQVMCEFLGPDAPVVIDGVGTFALSALLPMGFSLSKEYQYIHD